MSGPGRNYGSRVSGGTNETKSLLSAVICISFPTGLRTFQGKRAILLADTLQIIVGKTGVLPSGGEGERRTPQPQKRSKVAVQFL